MSDAAKQEARAAARAARTAAASEAASAAACARLARALEAHRGKVLAGYLPIGSEIDPRPVMADWVAAGGTCAVPLTEGAGKPLRFARWTPETLLTPGGFGTQEPAEIEPLVPEVLIVPLLAFDRLGNRLGYGQGHYDRTLAALRARGPIVTLGFAFAGQETPAPLPIGPYDVPLDAIVTEREVIRPAPLAPGSARA